MRRGAAVAALAASGAAAWVAFAAASGQRIPGYGRPGGGVRNTHGARLRYPRGDLHDGAHDSTIGQHVEVVVAPLADRELV